MKGNGKERSAFTDAYGVLNAMQKQAVDTIEGPVLVIAGPGTGKTQILTLRIANILLQTDTKPENILALTFTESGARAMRERLVVLIGETAYDIPIYTFHGFADQLIRRYPDAYERIIGGRPASDIERITIIEEILSDTQFKVLRPSGDPTYYVKPIRDAISDLKQEYITPNDFAAAIEVQEQALTDIPQFHEKGAHKGKVRGEYKEAVKHLDRNRELLLAYRLYDSLMRERKLYDFDDMIVETVTALVQNEDMLRDVQEQYQYVLADEHQDVNGSQNKILELIVNFHERPNLFAVGDEKQAIYRFQGASLDNFLYFDDVFQGTVSISLTDNYRSGQTILDAAQALIDTDDEVLQKLRVPLQAKAVTQAQVLLHDFVHETLEHDWLIKQVQACLDQEVEARDIAIIVRTNREVEAFAVALRKAGIAAAASADSDILEHPITHMVDTLLQAVTNPTNEALLTTLLHLPCFSLSYADIARILAARTRDIPLAVMLNDEQRLKELHIQDIPAVLAIQKTLLATAARSVIEPPHRALETLLTESGFVSFVVSESPLEGATILRRLYDEVEGMVRRKEVQSLEDVSKQLALHRQHNVPLNAPLMHLGEHAVQVMTAHKSKGLEFEIVFIPHLTDRIWGKKNHRTLFQLPIVKHDVGDFDVLEDDERRLLYVAMTRAKKQLLLSYGNENVEGKEQTPSRFLTECSSEIAHVDTSSLNKDFSPVTDIVALQPEPMTTEIILETLERRGVSPTALNNFLKSPWEYFYRNVLHIPQVKTTELQYGSAIHYVLDQMVVRQEQSDSFIAHELRVALNKEALSDEEFARLHERGLQALLLYRDTFLLSVTNESRTEVKLEALMQTGLPEYPELKINGTLDRVDYKDGNIIRVIDYKTGKPKTRGFIEGATKDSNGEYKRQLVFYALLLSLQEDQAKHCRTGVLSFVEADKNGTIKEEVFTVTDEEIETLKKELVTMVKQILTGQALTVRCDPQMCHYCDLVEMMQQKKRL